MKKIFYILPLLICLSSCNGNVVPNISNNESANSQISNTDGSMSSSEVANDSVKVYYKNALGLSGDNLEKTLHEIIYTTCKDEISYDDCDSYVADCNEDPNNPDNCILLYSGHSSRKDNFHQGNSYPKDFWNKEHVWAKSLGDFKNMQAGRDLHHLMPTYSGINSRRSNDYFGEVSHTERNAITEYNAYGEKIKVNYVDPNDMSYSDGTYFEPRNAVKGDVARMIMYMAIRYDGGDGGPDLILKNPLLLVLWGIFLLF